MPSLHNILEEFNLTARQNCSLLETKADDNDRFSISFSYLKGMTNFEPPLFFPYCMNASTCFHPHLHYRAQPAITCCRIKATNSATPCALSAITEHRMPVAMLLQAKPPHLNTP